MTVPSGWEPDHRDIMKQRSEKQNKQAGFGCAALFVVFVGGCAALTMAGGDDSTDTTSTSDNGQEVGVDRLGAFDVCKQFVSQRLKAPGPAEWRDPFGDQVSYSGDGAGPITVTASVDAQNSFGASIRNDYRCTVQRSGDRWQLVSLSGLE